MMTVARDVHYRISSDDANPQVTGSSVVLMALRDSLDMLGKATPDLAWCVAGVHGDDPVWAVRCAGPGGSMDVRMCSMCVGAVSLVIEWWMVEFPWTSVTGLNVEAGA